MQLKPNSFSVLALCVTLVWTLALPESTYAQKGGRGGAGKGRGGGNSSQSRGSSRGGTPSNRSMPGNSYRGGPPGGGPGFGGSSNQRGNATRPTDKNFGPYRGTPDNGSRPSQFGNTRTDNLRPNYGGNRHPDRANGQAGKYNHDGFHNYRGSFYGQKYPNNRPAYNQFYLGGGGLGYVYAGRGFGISIGLPLNGFYGGSYFDNYNFFQPNYVPSYPQPVYPAYVSPTALPVEVPGVVGPGVAIPTPDPNVAAIGTSVIPASGNAGQYQAQAEQAFRERSYQEAARLSSHALVEDGQNGKLHLFASQIFFALGDYRASAAAIQQAAALLDRSEWGFVVQNFKKFYRGDEYVTQMDALVKFTKANPNLAYLHFLRGYHYFYLGYDKAAQARLARAVELESRDLLAAELLVMAGGKKPDVPRPAQSVLVNDQEARQELEQIPLKAPDSLPIPDKDSDKDNH